MSGENIVVYLDANQKTLSSNGAAIASGAIAVAASATYDVIADGSGYPDGSFVFTGSFATAPVENTTLSLYAQPLGIDSGPVDAQAPETTRPTMVIGSFVVNNVTGAQSIVINAYDLPRRAAYWLFNNQTGQSLAAGWTLKVTPRTFKVAP
jgi:hypothetical protein